MKFDINENKTEAEIISILKLKVEGSDSYNQSELAEQRQDNTNMYYLNPLGNEVDGLSQVQSADVFDAVEGTKAIIHEALTSGRDLLMFEPQNEDDIDGCKMANKYAKDRFHQNGGYRFIIDSLHDGLLSKNAVCKVFWTEDIDESYEQFTGLNQQQVSQAVQQPNVSVYDYEELQSIDPNTGQPFSVFSGTFLISEDKSHASFRLIKPEDFYGDETAETMDASTFGSDREVLRKGDLIEDYPHLEKEIRNAPIYNDSRQDQDALTRRSNDDSWRTKSQDEKAIEREPVEVHDCYIMLWGNEGYGMYRFKMVGMKYLLWDMPESEEGEESQLEEQNEQGTAGGDRGDEIEMPEGFDPAQGEFVDGLPYLQWSPYPLAHRWDGLAQADSVRDIQLSTTNLKRSIIDHTMRTNNPMREANLEFIRNPEDLIDNVIGAVIDKEMAAGQGQVVTVVDQPQLNPASFSVLEMLKQEGESRSSFSRLAGGLNGDAVKQQNSKDLISSLTDSSNRRIMMMTRNLVELYLKPLYISLYNMGVTNDQREYNVEINGNWQMLSPNKWPNRYEMKVVTSMTPMAATQSAMAKMQVHQMLIADPETQLIYSDKKRYNMYSEILNELGETAIDRFLENPESEEYKQAQQGILKQQQQQQQMQQKQQQQMQMQTEAMQKMQMQMQQFSMQMQKQQADQAQQKIDNDAQIAADKMSLEEDKQTHKEDIDESELILEAKKIKLNSNVSGVSVG